MREMEDSFLSLCCSPSASSYIIQTRKRTLDLANWAFNTIDRILSTVRFGERGPTCPSGTDPVGYILDSWSMWRPLSHCSVSLGCGRRIWLFANGTSSDWA